MIKTIFWLIACLKKSVPRSRAVCETLPAPPVRGSTILSHQTANPTATPGWAANGRELQILIAVLLLACAIAPVGFIAQAVSADKPLYPDFFGLWSFGRYVLGHPPATIYDTTALYRFQATLGMTAADGLYPFPYPPWILLLLAPLALLPVGPAMAVWLATTVAAFLIALTAWRWRNLAVGFLLLAPSSTICLIVGQNGFLTGALMLAGLRLLTSAPLAAGALLAAVAFKPQFAVLLPFLLLFGGHWRAIAGALLATLALSLAATLAFGPAIWPAWLAATRAQLADPTMGRDTLLDMMPTLTAAATLLHAPPTIARAIQLLGALAALAAVWHVRARTDLAARAVVPLATLLATPYAFHYDLPMVTGAIVALLVTRTHRVTTGELLILLGCLLAPSLLVLRAGQASAIVPAVFALAVWHLAKTPRLPDNAACPTLISSISASIPPIR